jgi:HCOMODA/2-hydroxy-3-carboxy-muconic semialdehyde decarboxylase
MEETRMPSLDADIAELVTANRILAAEGVVDAFGHVSLRHQRDPKRFLLSRARAPELVEAADIMEFTLEGEPLDAAGRKPYLERFIHGAIFEMRPDANCVIHNHSPAVIPFGVTGQALRPIMHICAMIGHEVPIWDSQAKFGDTNLLVSDMAMGRDLALALGGRRAALMRGHGCVVAGPTIRSTVYAAVYLQLNAALQMEASRLGTIKFLSAGEIDAIAARSDTFGVDRAWERWCRRAGMPFT